MYRAWIQFLSFLGDRKLDEQDDSPDSNLFLGSLLIV